MAGRIKILEMFLRMIVRALFRQKSRMFVALLAVAVGAAIISGMITVYREVPAQLGREFRAYGANVLLLPAGEAKTFDSAALQKAHAALAGRDVVGLAPFLYERLEVNKQPVLTGGTDFEEVKKVSPYWMIKGAYPKAGEREIILGAEMAAKIARDTDKLIGQTVSVSAGEGKAMLSFTVSGIVSTGGKEEQFAFLNLDELQKIVEKPGAVGLAQLSVVADGESLKSALGVQRLEEARSPDPSRDDHRPHFDADLRDDDDDGGRHRAPPRDRSQEGARRIEREHRHGVPRRGLRARSRRRSSGQRLRLPLRAEREPERLFARHCLCSGHRRARRRLVRHRDGRREPHSRAHRDER